MSAQALFTAQAHNNAWANETLWQTCATLSEAAFSAPRPGFFGSIAATLDHIYEVDLYYYDALAEGGRGRAVYEREAMTDPARLRDLQMAQDRLLIGFCEALTEADLTAMRRTERREGMMAERVDRLLLHLFQHQVHHRGQVHAMLSHAGVAPPQLDDFYLTYGRAPSARRYWED